MPTAPDGTLDEIEALDPVEIPTGATEKEQAEIALDWIFSTMGKYGRLASQHSTLTEWVKDEGFHR